MERYKGKPFIRLLELYILDITGELSSRDEKLITAMIPDLRKAYDHYGTWKQIIEDVMDLPEGFYREIRRLWIKNCSIASEKKYL